MANHDDKKPVNNGEKFEKAAQIGSLVLGAFVTLANRQWPCPYERIETKTPAPG
jgi:hypothetical protein